MALEQIQHDNLFKAFGLFIEAIRPYIVELLSKEAGDKWPAWYVESLHPQQRDFWNQGLKTGSTAESLIDYHHLKGFVLKYKDLLKKDFGKEVNSLATHMGTIFDIRNKLAHFKEISQDEYNETFIHLKKIARAIQMQELETVLIQLQNHQSNNNEIQQKAKTENRTLAPEAWFLNVTPHMDIRQGRLDESVFAANLGEVALGMGREIYNNPIVFFQKTYFTAGLKNIAKRVVNGLNGGQDAENRVISLQTGFGGGKTHTLISLYHLAKLGNKALKSESTKNLIAATGAPNFETANIAVFTNTTNDPVQGRQIDGITINTLWGELAYQLGGRESYELIRMNDEKKIAPKGLFKQVLAKCKPCLILIDELADYCISAAAVKVEASNLKDQTISFLQELTEAVSGTDNCVLIATLPASVQELASSANSAEILTALENRIIRIGSNMKPVEDDEIFEVVRRRLFEDLGDEKVIEEVVSSYSVLYQSLFSELPTHALSSIYKDKLKKSYPFHPELIDMFRLRWASNPFFQRTRGVLRLLAAIVSDLWKRQYTLTGSQYLIHTSDVVLSNLEALSSQITILNGASWDTVITADVSGTSSNSFRIDTEIPNLGKNNIVQGIASTILLGSFGSNGQNKGTGIDEIKLCMVKPNSFNHNDINGALDRMEANAHYLYYSSSGIKRYWFETTPNINILINQAKGDIKTNDIHAEILKRITDKVRTVNFFNVLTNPSEDIPEQMKPTLVILGPQHIVNPNDVTGLSKQTIEKLATKKGNSERIYRNTMLFLICSEIGIGKLQDVTKNYLSCLKINFEYATQLNNEQKGDIKRRIEEASKQADNALVAAYSIVAKHSARKGIETMILKQYKETLDSQINFNLISALKEEEWLLESVGLNTLKNNNLLPTTKQSIKAKDVYEAFIRFDDKPMISGQDAVAKSLLKYCTNGEFTIATGDGSSFTRFFYKETVPFFDLSDISYWLVDNSLRIIETPKEDDKIIKPYDDKNPLLVPVNEDYNLINDESDFRKFKSLTISGKVPLEQYTQLFNSFIMPLAQNNIEIEIKIKGKSTLAKPLNETSQEYKIVKESAKQLGLNFEEEL